MVKINENKLAWAAGFFDGEGCILTTKPIKNKVGGEIRLSIGQVNARPLKEFQKLFGGSIILEKRGVYKWQLSGYEAVFSVLEQLEPYLILKDNEVAIALKYKKYYAPVVRGQYTEEIFLMRNRTHSLIKGLKDANSTTRKTRAEEEFKW